MEIIFLFDFLRNFLLSLIFLFGLILVLLKRNFLVFLEFILILSLIFISVQLLKNLTKIPRPVDSFIQQKSFDSFPSSHTALSFGISIFLLKNSFKLGIFSLLVSFLIAFFSIFSLAHWPLDIFFGAFLGLFISFLVLYFFQRLDFQKRE